MICITNTCNNPVKNKKRQLCSRCYKYFLRTDAPHKKRCPVEGCSRPQILKGHCDIHARRLTRGGTTDGVGRGTPGKTRGIRNMSGSYVTPQGYIKKRIYVDNKPEWVLEHRWVMQKKLCRPLLPGENVHHLNGNKVDNHPENLELWITFQPAGQRPKELLDWADEIIRRYR